MSNEPTIVSRVAEQFTRERCARPSYPEFPDFSLEMVRPTMVRIVTMLSHGINDWFEGGISDIDFRDMEKDVSDEAGHVFERMKKILRAHGLEIVPGSGRTINLYNANKTRVDFPWQAEVELRPIGLDFNKLASELKRVV